jgi:hypothetical protein
MLSLKTLLALKSNVLYPGHGPHVTGKEACQLHIQNYIDHREERENQILQILETARTDLTSTTKALQALWAKHRSDAEEHDRYKESFMTGIQARMKGLTDEEKKAKEKEVDDAMKGLEVEGGVKVVSLDNIARQIYKTPDEKILFAGKKSLLAHLNKLVQEGKVVKGKSLNPVILDSEVRAAEDIEGYALAEMT